MSIAAQFADQQWQVLDERQVAYGEFSSVEFQELPDTVAVVSSSFESFDERPRKFATKRKHMPAMMAERIEQEELARHAEEISTLKIKPEEYELAKQKAFDDGFEAARQQITDTNLEKFEALEKRLVTVLKDIVSQQEMTLAGLEQQSLLFALQLSKKLLDQVVEVNPEYIVPLIKRSIRLASGAVLRKIRVSPQDYEFIRVVGIQKLFPESEEQMQFEPDESIRAGCIVETSAGEIDANLEESFERIKDSILKKK